MATWYAQAAGNWDAVSGGTTSSVWFDAASGGNAMDITGRVSGTTWTHAGHVYNLNGIIVNLNVGGSVTCSVSVDQILATAAGGGIKVGNSGAATITVALTDGVTSTYAGAMISWGTGTCSLTINGTTGNVVTYSGTFTSGMIPVAGSQTLVTNTGTIANSGSGYAIVNSNGTVTINNVDATAVNNTGSGRALRCTGGTTNVNGNGDASAGMAVSTAATCVVNYAGNINASGSGQGISCGASGVTIAFAGNPTSSGAGVALSIIAGTLTWTGTRTLAALTDCRINVTGGTLALASATAALALTNSGRLLVDQTGGTITTTAAGGTASIIRNSAAAQCVFLGGDYSSIITGGGRPEFRGANL